MDSELPAEMIAECDALIVEIYAAFEGVTRKGGVSFSEAQVIDNYGTDEDREEARESDRENGWQDLVGDADWEPHDGFEWHYLDAIGARYYLPAAMLRTLSAELPWNIPYHLTLHRESERERLTEQWSLLDLRQRQCVVRFLRYMLKRDHALLGFTTSANQWAEALRSFWTGLPDLKAGQ